MTWILALVAALVAVALAASAMIGGRDDGGA